MRIALLLLCGALAFDAGGVEVTYLANEGYLVQGDEQSVLIDAFIPEPRWDYEGLTDAHWTAIRNGRAPFDGVSIAVASHEHADHIQPGAAASVLSASPITLFTTPATARKLDLPEDAPGTVSAVLPGYGEETTVSEGDVSLTFLRMQHMPDIENDVENLAVIIEIDGVRILQIGDAYPLRANFEPFSLAARDIDLALIPDWFYDTGHFPNGHALIAELVAPRRIVPTHMAVTDRRLSAQKLKAQFPQLEFLLEPGQRLVIEGR